MGWILEDVLCLPEAVRTVEVFQGRKGAASDLLGHGDNSLERLRVCCRAAGKPCADTVCKNALDGALIKGQKADGCF